MEQNITWKNKPTIKISMKRRNKLNHFCHKLLFQIKRVARKLKKRTTHFGKYCSDKLSLVCIFAKLVLGLYFIFQL